MNSMESPSQVAFGCYDIFNHIMTYVSEKNGGYGRVENMELSLKVIRISRQFRRWYFFSRNGPYKFTAKEINSFIGDCPRELRCFLGILNQAQVRNAKISFDYIDTITRKGFHGNPLELFPKEIRMNVMDYEDLSPLDRLIPIAIVNPSSYRSVLEKVLKESHPSVICKALTRIFTNNNKYPLERYLALADYLIDYIIEKTGSHQLALEALQPYLAKILFFKPHFLLISYEWIKNKGFLFSADNVADCFSYTIHLREIRTAFLEVMEDVLQEKDVIINVPTSKGDYPIHRILETSNEGEDREKFLQMILNKDPEAIDVKNRDGKTPLIYLANALNHELLETLRPYLNETVLWKQREECHQFIYKWLVQSRLENYHFHPTNVDESIAIYLRLIKLLFTSDEKFEKWLCTPWVNGKCLLHEMAVWSSSLISDLFSSKFFSSSIFDHKFDYKHTLLELQGLHLKLLRSQGLCNLEEIVQVAPQLIAPSFLFGLYERQFFSNGNPFLLGSLLEITGTNFKDNDGNTLLHQIFFRKFWSAAIPKMQEAITFMLDRGADPELRNNKGESAKDIAIRNDWVSDNFNIRCFLGNQDYVRIAKISFGYIHAITKKSFHGQPLAIYPEEMSTNVVDYDNQTPFDRLIPSLLFNPVLYHPLFNKLLEESLPSVIAQALCRIFLPGNQYSLERALDFADRCITKLEQKTGTNQLAMDALQPHLSKILLYKSEEILRSYEWIKKKGLIFTVDNISDCLWNNLRDIEDVKVLLEVLVEILPSMNIVGDHPIHAILSNPLLGGRKKYLQLVLEKDPNACHAVNKEGMTALFLLYKNFNHELIEIIKPYFNETILSEQRIECQKRILQWLGSSKVNNEIFSLNLADHDILKYLKIIKQLFPSDEKFEEWLVEPMEDGVWFLHKMALWSSSLIDKMYEEKLFSKDKFYEKSIYTYNLSEYQSLHNKLIAICDGKRDMEGLKEIVQEMPHLLSSKFLYNLFDQQFFSNGNPYLLEFILEIKGANFTDNDGNTLLHKIVSKPFHATQIPQMKAAIAFVIDRGINPSIENDDGETARDIAIKNGWESLLQMLK